MKIWTIWIQADEHTWLEDAWEDEMTAENRSGYEQAVEKAGKIAKDNGGIMRIIAIEVPDAAIFGAFEIPTVQGTAEVLGGGEGTA